MSVGWLRTIGKRVALRVSAVVAKNELFERYGERPVQPPLQPGTWVAPSGEEDSSDDDDKEPDCRVATVADVHSKIQAGPLVIHHWATWCESCLEEMPVIRRLIGRTSVPVLGLSWDAFEGQPASECTAAVMDAMREYQLNNENWVLDVDPEGFFEEMGMEFRQVPQTWVINGAGEIVHRNDGIVSPAALDELLHAVESLT
jgi:hypothetical protein